METAEFQTIVRDHHPMIYKICRVYSSTYDFDDLYQEVLINLWTSLKRFKAEAKLSTWVYRVALNTALTYKRKSSKHESNVPLTDFHGSISTTDDEKQQEFRVNVLLDAVSKLDKVDRSVMLLYLDEKKYEEIAEITGLSASNVGVKINRAKKRLKELLHGKL